MLGHACHTEAVPAHRCFKGPAGGHGVGSLDVKSVRDPGQHQHSAASLGSASQHSKPSRASIDAYSLLPQPQSPHTTDRGGWCTVHDAQRMMERGLARRRTNETRMNAESSRSHAVLTLHLKSSTRTDLGLLAVESIAPQE
ncbi:g3779 [Coccomyxa viridis]|uniref:G3773 protein n=1 Tax=Coccomyxa viridis TaxID=1274662 RepID=A0ABP1FNK4_9CHLO